MIRTFLGVGDKATNGAFITQGLDSVSCSNPPPRVQISTVGMETYCPVCKQKGHIGPRGPRHRGTGPNGQQWALSGDINICGCNPPPVFYAERNMTMRITAEDAGTLTGGTTAPRPPVFSGDAFDQTFQLTDGRTGEPLSGVPYRITTDDGEKYEGRTDAHGCTQRVSNARDTSVTLHVLEEVTPIDPQWDQRL